MTALSPSQLDIARILFALPASSGFALAGGSALVAHGTVDRPTRDIDAFIAAKPMTPPGDVTAVATELRVALEAQGWLVSVFRDHQTFSRLLATKNNDAVEIDLAVDSPPLFSIEFVDGLPLLAPQDLAARKILAIIDRAEGRDFTDLDALQRQFSQDDCIRWAQSLDAGLTVSVIAESFGKLSRLADAELPTSDPSSVRQSFANWARRLTD